MIAPVLSLSRRERERLQRRQEILTAARAVFAQRGYVRATLDEVAEQAELGKGTLYNYFPGGKDEILFTLFEDLFTAASDLIRNHFAGEPSPPTVDSYHRLVARIVDFYAEDRQAFLLFIKEAQRMVLGDNPLVIKKLLSYREPALKALTEAIEESISAGILRPFPADHVAHMLFGIIHGYLAHAFHEHNFENPAECSAALTDEGTSLISDILFNGLKV